MTKKKVLKAKKQTLEELIKEKSQELIDLLEKNNLSGILSVEDRFNDYVMFVGKEPMMRDLCLNLNMTLEEVYNDDSYNINQ